MNHSVTSKEEILSVCRDIVRTEGIQGVNARRVAGQLGIALGSLYNYYPGKEALVMASVASVWQDILSLDGMQNLSFADTVDRIVRDLAGGQKKYPNFFASHAMVFGTKADARAAMGRMEAGLQQMLKRALAQDPAVCKEIDPDAFVQVMMDLINGMVLRSHFDAESVLAVVDAYAYGGNDGRDRKEVPAKGNGCL